MRAFVARSTFYRHYHHVDEVLECVERHLLRGLMEAGSAWSVRTSERVSLAGTVAYVRVHEREFRALLLEPVDARFVEAWKDAIKFHCWQRLFVRGPLHAGRMDGVVEGRFGMEDAPDSRPIANRRLLLEIVASSMVAAVTFALREPNAGDGTWRDADDIVNLALSALDTVV